jgi:branched-chain amino acid transport system permease protein
MSNILQIVITALSLGSLYALTALGIGLLFGVLRLVNFAYGAFITAGAFALIVPSQDASATLAIGALPAVLIVVAIVVVVVLISILSEAAVFRNLRKASPATLMIASFALGYMIQNMIIMANGSRPKAVGLWSDLMGNMQITDSVGVPRLQFVIIGLTMTILAGLAAFLSRTSVGLQMRAAAEDFQMAQMLGVRGNRVIGTAFALSGVIAAFSSLILVVQTGVLDYEMGVPLMLFGFISTVIGGMGSLVGTVLGGYLVGILSVLLQTFLPEDARGFRDAIVFTLVIAILLLRPQGLVASPTMKERV